MAQEPSRRRDDPFRWVLDVSAMLMVAPGERESLQPVARAIGEGMNASGADILSFDAERGALVQEATWDPEGVSAQDLAFVGTVIPLDDNPMFRRLIVSRRVEERHWDDIDLTEDEARMFAEWGYKTTLDAPLIVGDEIVGALGVTEKRYARHFMTMEVQRFEKFASMAAAAIRNARVFRREQQQSRRLDVLLEMSGLITGSTDLRQGLIAGAQALATGLGATWMALYEGNATSEAPRLLARRTTQTAASTDGEGDGDEARSLAGLEGTLASREPCAVSVTDADIDAALQAEMVRLGEHARLGLPLLCRSNVVGLLAMGWRDGEPELPAEQLQYAGSAAELLGFALENARLEATGS